MMAVGIEKVEHADDETLLQTALDESRKSNPPQELPTRRWFRSASCADRRYGVVPNDAADSEDLVDERTKRKLTEQFVFMSLALSLNHASVVACLSLSVSTLGTAAGNASDAALYIAYTSTALLLSSGVVKTVGVKGSLVAGSLSYCLYIGSFYFATAAVDERVSFYAAFAGALIGGVAGAVLFTAQGIFFSKTAMLISESSLPGSVDSSLPTVTSKLASVFACIYLFCEVLFKMVATILPRYFNLGFESVFTLYFVLAVAAGLSMSFVHAPDLPQSTISAANGPISCGRELLATLSLLTKDSRAGLLIGTNLAFGFASTWATSYVSGTVVTVEHGAEWVGLLSAIMPTVAGAAAVPLGYVAVRCGKLVVITIGACGFMAVTALPLALERRHLGQWHVLIGLYVFEGLGRAVFEGVNKAVFADFFAAEREAGFALVIFSSGAASAASFFMMYCGWQNAVAWTGLALSTYAPAAFAIAILLSRQNGSVYVRSEP